MNCLWKPIRNYAGYEVSETGLIRNVNTQRLLKPYCRPGDKHIVIALSGNTKYHNLPLGRLVYTTFVRPLEGCEVIHHKDGNPANNAVTNLEALFSQNCHNRMHARKLNSEAIKVIRFLRGKVTRKKLAELYHISIGYTSAVQNGHYWKEA